MPRDIDQNDRPVIFGELLYDHYPKGKKYLGGAPLNVAWHLQGFGLRPILVTRIGQDFEGELALMDMINWGLDTRAVQIDHEFKTGYVVVNQQQGDNQFEIKPNQAWDFISSGLVMEWLRHLPCSLVYAGSLAQRSPVSHKTLQRIMLETELPVFTDINLRAPWTEATIIEQCLNATHWLKVNRTELTLLAGIETDSIDKIKQAVLALKTKYDIGEIFVTDGEKGSILINNSGVKKLDANSAKEVDTVGAGDAYSAVAILGIHLGWSDFNIIKNANEFAACICEGKGGTPLKKNNYVELLNKWIKENK